VHPPHRATGNLIPRLLVRG